LRALPHWRKLVVFSNTPAFLMNIDQITQRLHAVRDQNDWQRFHSPKNLAMAASVEMAELVEIFQWQTEDESRQLSADKLEHAGQEVGATGISTSWRRASPRRSTAAPRARSALPCCRPT